MRTSPDVRSSRPEKQFSKVVFPQPDGPIIATISPRGIARFTPRSAWTLTNPELYTLWASTPRMIGSAARLEGRPRISQGDRLRIRSDEPHCLAHLREVLRRSARPVLLEQGPQRGERRVRVGRPFAEDEPPGRLQDAVDFLEHAVVAEGRDPEVAGRRVEQFPAVHDVPRVEHLEPDVWDGRIARPVLRRRDRAVS